MKLNSDEFIRRFLMHVLPRGFHRIRHYGFFANTVRAENLVQARELLADKMPRSMRADSVKTPTQRVPTYICPLCAAPMLIIDILARGHTARAPPAKLCA